MNTEMSSLELEYIIRELKKIEYSRIDKIFANENKDLLIQVYKAEIGKPILRAHVPRYTYLTEFKPSFSHPSNFCMRLRKKLKNGLITGISKLENERIIKLTIETKNENGVIVRHHMYFEFFLKGNIILTDNTGVITAVAEMQIWADRKLKIGEDYHIPKKTVRALTSSLDKDLVKFIAEDMNFGGELAEEICFRASLDKKRRELDHSEVRLLDDIISGIMDYDKNTKGYLYRFKNGRKIYPFRMQTVPECESIKEFSSFNEAVDTVLTDEFKSTIKESVTKKKSKYLNKYERIIDAQKKQLDKNQKIIDESTKKAELIYKNYTEISEIFEQLKKARETMDWTEIKKNIKNNKIIDIDEKSGKIILDLE